MPSRHPGATEHDYLPAFGRDALLPFYDLLTSVLRVPKVHGQLLDLACLDDDTATLEIGCGTGNLTLMAKRRHPRTEVVGLDPDPLALARATRKAGSLDVRFDRGYGQALPYQAASFDRVLSAFMLHHLAGEAREQTAAEARRVLRPGGALYLVDIGGRVAPSDGYAARRSLRSPHLCDNLGDRIPQLLLGAGFDECVELTHRVGRLIGRITFYRASLT
ncbi:class I SAM-dependent methyltransferase [Pseudonocardia acaciae]|uniref:class I SAM-dependent methyltransferase n=1 Tax=Pseudonocardia acaciae TaxID=551276 RepID=UPI00048C761B|nr:class I SAM-dependent methyltransferase [Pseudonocardia acaciae]